MLRTIAVLIGLSAFVAFGPALALEGAKAGADPSAKLEPYADSQGLCAVTLPAGWFFGDNPGMGSGLVISSEPLAESGAYSIGCEIVIGPKFYSSGMPGSLSEKDASLRDNRISALSKEVAKGGKVETTKAAEPFDLCGMDARRLEVAVGPKKGDGPVSHRLVVVAARHGTVVSVAFRAPEAEWAKYAEIFEAALKTVEVFVGNDAPSPLLPNKESALYGDALLFCDRVGTTLGDEWVPLAVPSAGTCAGWEADAEKRHVAVAVVDGTDAKRCADEQAKSLTSDWKLLETKVEPIRDGLAECVMSVTAPDGDTRRMVVRILQLPEDRLLTLTATLVPEDEAGWAKANLALGLMEQPLVQPVLAGANATTVAIGAAKVKFTPPKDWRTTREKCRSVIGFEIEDDAVWLVVRRPEAERCHSWKSEEREQRMLTLAGGVEQVLAEKKLPGGVGGQDIERTTLSTRRGENPVWRKTRTLHRGSCVATLSMRIPLEKDEKPAVAEKRAASVFTSFKVEGK